MRRGSTFELGVVVIALVALVAGRAHVAAAGVAAPPPNTAVRAVVTHVSSEHAYIDAGAASGIAVDDTLEVWRGERRIGAAVTLFVAAHSAACRLVSGPELETGDRVVARVSTARSKPTYSTATDLSAAAPSATAPATLPAERGDGARGRSGLTLGDIHGSISSQWYHARLGTEGSRVEIDEPTARLTMRANRLFGQNIDARVRLRLRRHEGGVLDADDGMAWRDRLYELTVSYASTGGDTEMRMGRLAPRAISGIGYVDGLTFSHAVTPRTRFGLVGGRHVTWGGGRGEPIIEKYGMFVETRRDGPARVTGTLAAVAEYQAGDINREYVSARGQVRRGIVDVDQLLEVDVNRGWRSDRAAGRLTVARVRSAVRVRPSRAMRFNVSFDSTERPWTARYRSVPDSLFDDAMPRGFRVSSDIEPVEGWSLRVGGAVRGRDGESETTRSWDVGLSARRLPIDRLGVHLRAAGFDGGLARGVRPEVRVDMSLAGGHRVELAAGRYRYETDFTPEGRENDWLSAVAYLRLSPIAVRTSVTVEKGDDAPGRRLLSELIYHF